jgi:hypothetical protein
VTTCKLNAIAPTLTVMASVSNVEPSGAHQQVIIAVIGRTPLRNCGDAEGESDMAEIVFAASIEEAMTHADK